ncbi:hypothetical protein D3C86_1760160 [compost metagenome]
MKGGGLSSEATSDDDDIGNCRALQGGRYGRLRRGLFPETVRAGVVIHRSTMFRASSFVFRMSDKPLFMRLYKRSCLLNIDISSRVHSVREYGSAAAPFSAVTFAAGGFRSRLAHGQRYRCRKGTGVDAGCGQPPNSGA